MTVLPGPQSTSGRSSITALDQPAENDPNNAEKPVDVEKTAGNPAHGPSGGEGSQYPPIRTVIVIMTGVYFCMFLVALDRTIISTAVPQITDDFDSLNDVGWYSSAYLITSCAFQLIYGRIYTFYNTKWVFLASVAIFETGSALCGAAPNSSSFIGGRALAGLGSSGIFSGVIVIMIPLLPLHKRPMWQGFSGAIFGVSSVVGPLIGGALTNSVTWRWCFYLNLPIGGFSTVIVLLMLHVPSPKEASTTWKQQAIKLDPLGSLVFLPSIVCLLLALQWGGTQYAWDSGRIIALLVLFGVLFLTFIGIQLWQRENATIPPRIIAQRSIAAGLTCSICVGATMMVFIYYLPIWLQAIKNADAMKSGIMILPLILSLVIASILAGIVVSKVGYYTPFLLAGTVFMAIGAGLMTTFKVDTNHAKWIGYQFIYGFGQGMAMQQSGMAAQASLQRKDIPTGVSLMFFGQSLGGAIFVCVGQSIFSTKLAAGLKTVAGLDPNSVFMSGATDLRNAVSADKLSAVLTAAFIVGTAMATLAFFGALAMEWRSVKKANAEMMQQAKGGPVLIEAQLAKKFLLFE
ncbi:major facilitator superfamily domain-containing protein [Lipomyces orientalis]|uniref:Major facilitator superfamily domain-containing protein n=1 Tax=Lipomyces orientalis TaxID=1233043 RepID=A0ACC3TE19_9ASCO